MELELFKEICNEIFSGLHIDKIEWGNYAVRFQLESKVRLKLAYDKCTIEGEQPFYCVIPSPYKIEIENYLGLARYSDHIIDIDLYCPDSINSMKKFLKKLINNEYRII